MRDASRQPPHRLHLLQLAGLQLGVAERLVHPHAVDTARHVGGGQGERAERDRLEGLGRQSADDAEQPRFHHQGMRDQAGEPRFPRPAQSRTVEIGRGADDRLVMDRDAAQLRGRQRERSREPVGRIGRPRGRAAGERGGIPIREPDGEAHEIQVPHQRGGALVQELIQRLVGIYGGRDFPPEREGMELLLELARHVVEGRRDIGKLVAARGANPRGEVALGDLPGRVLELGQGRQVAANLLRAEEQHDQERQQEDQEEDPLERGDRSQHIVLGLAHHHGPRRHPHGGLKEDGPAGREVRHRSVVPGERSAGPRPRGGQGRVFGHRRLRVGQREERAAGVVHDHEMAAGGQRPVLFDGPERVGIEQAVDHALLRPRRVHRPAHHDAGTHTRGGDDGESRFAARHASALRRRQIRHGHLAEQGTHLAVNPDHRRGRQPCSPVRDGAVAGADPAQLGLRLHESVYEREADALAGLPEPTLGLLLQLSGDLIQRHDRESGDRQ